MLVRTLPVYLDSSVIGGYFDIEFEDATRKLWSEMKAGTYRFVSSLLVDEEIADAPQRVQDLMADTFSQADLLAITLEVEELAAAYMAEKIVPGRFEDDATRVAIASVHQIGLLASWNFKHLVNFQRETAFNAVNLLQGYPTVRIVSPLELIHENDD